MRRAPRTGAGVRPDCDRQRRNPDRNRAHRAPSIAARRRREQLVRRSRRPGAASLIGSLVDRRATRWSSPRRGSSPRPGRRRATIRPGSSGDAGRRQDLERLGIEGRYHPRWTGLRRPRARLRPVASAVTSGKVVERRLQLANGSSPTRSKLAGAGRNDIHLGARWTGPRSCRSGSPRGRRVSVTTCASRRTSATSVALLLANDDPARADPCRHTRATGELDRLEQARRDRRCRAEPRPPRRWGTAMLMASAGCEQRPVGVSLGWKSSSTTSPTRCSRTAPARSIDDHGVALELGAGLSTQQHPGPAMKLVDPQVSW